MGGLAPDNDQPMPSDMQAKIQSIWTEIEQRTGAPFNHQFWKANTPRRSTYPACRAVIAAEKLKPGAAPAMISAIQHAYYQHALNPSDTEVLVSLAGTIGLDTDRFSNLLNNLETQKALTDQINTAHSLGAQGFPTLLLKSGKQIYPLAYGYSTPERLIERIERILLEGSE